MKTNEQVNRIMQTLDNMGKVKKIRWFLVKLQDEDWKTYHDVPMDCAQKMVNYCFNNEIRFEVEFYEDEKD